MSKHLNTLSTLKKKGIVRLTNEFIESLAERVELIVNSIHECEYTMAINETHKLKGIAGTFGFPEITDRCQDIEHNLRNKKYEQIEYLLTELVSLKNDALKKVIDIE